MCDNMVGMRYIGGSVVTLLLLFEVASSGEMTDIG
jgi:hypothetical protein